MDERKKLKKYIGASPVIRALAWIFAIAALASLAMCTLFKQQEDLSAATKFNPAMADTGDYTYIDIVGISDWVYKYTNDSNVTIYYSVEDADGYLYMVEMEGSDYSAIGREYKTYWERVDDSVAQPEPYRIYGTVGGITADRMSDFADVWTLSDSEFEEYFGDTYLNVGSSPASENNSMWLVATFFSGIMWLLFFIAGAGPNKQTKISLRELDSRGETEQAAAELDAENAVTIGRDKARATEHYLIGRKTGVVLRYEDIVWCYTDVAASRHSVNGFLRVFTKDRKNISAVNFGGVDFNELGQQTAQIIAEHNPQVMIGRTRDNSKQYKEIYKANK